ncbi:class I SAM-dependent methyltransferase [Thermodesulfobacteriota bacterium]
MNIFHKGRLKFEWRYWRGQTPWDTNITPPEVMAFIADLPPGRALDLGCGTGTNAITLARHGWRVTGVDFSAKAIRIARRKAKAAGFDIDFYTADVADLSMLSETYDYVLDIGCLFTIPKKDRVAYAAALVRLLRSKGWYMLYAWHPRVRNGRLTGIAEEEVKKLFDPFFAESRVLIGEENGFPSAWYWFQRL